jgi:hypothetical protein
MKFIFNPEREESAGKTTNGESKLPIGKFMTQDDKGERNEIRHP